MTFQSRDGEQRVGPSWHRRGRELSATGIFGMVFLIGKVCQQLCSSSENIRYSPQLVLAREMVENLGRQRLTPPLLAECTWKRYSRLAHRPSFPAVQGALLA
jgi:hypothetical protein